MIEPPDQKFWEFWRVNKAEMVALGISLKKEDSGAWSVCWWREISSSVQAARKDSVDLSRATDSAIDIPCPQGVEFLPYQKAGIMFANQRPGTLIGDEMGLGKTVQAIGIINMNPKYQDVLIICPCKLKLNWYRELRKWLYNDDLSVGIADSEAFPTTNIVIINYDIIHKWQSVAEKRMWDMICLDEAHYMKSPTARRSKAIIGYAPTKKEIKDAEMMMEYALAAQKLAIECVANRAPAEECARKKAEAEQAAKDARKAAEAARPSSGIPARRKVAMTGSPMPSRPIELQPIIGWLDRETWGNKWKFAQQYCGARRTNFGYDSSGSSNLFELQERLRQTVMVRRLKKDVLKDLPPKRREIVMLEGDEVEGIVNREAQALSKLSEHTDRTAQAQAAVELAKASDSEEVYKAAVEALKREVSVKFDQMAVVRHETAVAKMPLVIEYVEEMLESVEKILVLAYHRDVIEGIQAGLSKYGALKIYGGMSSSESQQAVDKFQNDAKQRVMVLSIPVAVGMTLTAASHCVAAELDWVPGVMSQAEDRLHRIGQREMVNVYHLVLPNSIDANMADTLIKKQAVLDMALDRLKVEEVANEPVAPSRTKNVTFTRKEIDEKSATLTQVQIDSALRGLQVIAQKCNGAKTWDAMGFSKTDSYIGHSLAGQMFLSPRQGVLAQKLINKYRKQLPAELVAVVTGKEIAE